MMREAAYMAGLTSDAPGITRFTPVGSPLPRPEEVNPEKLSLALEPEVAAIAAHKKSEVYGRPPQRYMVVDIGGGTVDITVHDKSNGRISVVLPLMGNNWGDTTVNEALSMSFIKSDTSVEATLDEVLEGTAQVKLPLPEPFIKHDNITEEARELNMLYNPEPHSITIGCDLLKEKVQVEKITEYVRAAFDTLTDHIDTVYLVGGFGGCRFVSQKIEEAIARHRGILYDNIVCPEQPDLAVVSGAVMWRKDPNIIQSRVADATYGTSVAVVFNPSIHDEHYKFLNNLEDSRQCCDNVFKVFALKGEKIKDEVYKTTFIPRYQSMTQDTIPIYCTGDDGVQYVRDKKGKPTVREIGQLILDLPNPDNLPRKERAYDVFMDFRGTEIQARAQYSITGEEVKTVCDFLSNQDNNEDESKV